MSDELLRLAYEASLTAHEQDLRETILQHYKFATVMFGDLPREREQHLAIADAALNEFAASRGLKLVPLVDRVGGEGLRKAAKALYEHLEHGIGWIESGPPDHWSGMKTADARTLEDLTEKLGAALVNDETGEPR